MTGGQKLMFGEGLMNLRAAYTMYALAPEEAMKMRDAWFEQLARFDWEIVRQALMEAPSPDHYPDKMPTVGQLARICHGIGSRLAEQRRMRETAAREAASDRSYRDRLNRIPRTPQGQAAYMAEVDGLEMSDARKSFERLARFWECEDASGQPVDGLDRMRQFWKTWEKTDARKAEGDRSGDHDPDARQGETVGEGMEDDRASSDDARRNSDALCGAEEGGER